MTYQELIDKSVKEYQLDEKDIHYLFKFYLKQEITDDIRGLEVNMHIVNEYFKKVRALKNGKPLQYVIGNVDFYGYNFEVNENVLIPRFETEQLVYYTKEYIKRYFIDPISLIDVGTGSGAIGISLKKELPNLSVTMTDISSDAIEVATKNAYKLDAKVEIFKSDMLDEVIKSNIKYDILISNPPYIREDEEIMDIVKDNEPSLALYGGIDGLKYYNILLSQAKSILKEKSLIAFEIGSEQAVGIIKLANKYFGDSPYEIKKDFTGRDRMFFLFYNLND